MAARISAQNGFSLLGVMFALGISGIIMLAMNQMLLQNRRMAAKIALDGEVEDLRHLLRTSLSCQANDCSANLVQVPDHIGQWHLRATCDDSGLKILALKMRPNSLEPSQHPLTGRPLSWQPLFKASEGYFCLTAVSASPAEAKQALATPSSMPPSELRPLGELWQGMDQADREQIYQQASGILSQLCPAGQTVANIDPKTMQLTCH